MYALITTASNATAPIEHCKATFYIWKNYFGVS